MILGRTTQDGAKAGELIHTDLRIDLPRLLETRLLAQANSGGGKSWLLRRLLEQTAPHVQHLIIDPEGEFSTLREKFDYIIAAPHDGDAVANPKTAALLARRLLETGVSAVLDIYDLKAPERQAFVLRFIDALINAPRKLWHPVLVVIDEAHIFCPQVGGAEAAPAVIDLCTRGRKRGMCAVLATTRLAKLHKDAAAETLNKLIGRTGLDVDVKRAADELGVTPREAVAQLRNLEPGNFYAFGPALSTAVVPVLIGEVVTTHPRSGQRLMQAPPAPSARVRASLAKLADLQVEAEQEVKDNEALRAEVAELKRKLAKAEKGLPAVDEAAIQRRIDEAVRQATINTSGRAILARQQAMTGPTIGSAAVYLAKRITKDAAELGALLGVRIVPNPGLPKDAIFLTNDKLTAADLHEALKPGAVQVVATPSTLDRGRGDRKSDADSDGLKAGAVRILRELVARLPAGYTKAQVGALTGFTPSGGTFVAYMGALRRGGYIDIRSNLIYATEAGAARVGGDVPPAPTSHEEAMALWSRALKSGAYRMLEAVVAAGTDGISRDALADAIDMQQSGGTFGAYLGILRRNGLIDVRGGIAVASDILFPSRS